MDMANTARYTVTFSYTFSLSYTGDKNLQYFKSESSLFAIHFPIKGNTKKKGKRL